MKLHTVFLSLTLAAASAHANLFDRLKEIEKDVSELKEAIEDISGDVDETGSETADNTKSLENSASAVEQDTASNALAESKSSSESRNSDSSTGQSLYGWLDSVSYSQGRSPMIDDLGLKNPGTYISISVFGVTRTISSELQCNALYLDRSLPEIDGISVGDLSGKSVQQMAQAFAPHRGTFIRLNNVQVHKKQNQKYCLAASAAVVDDLAKSNITFPQVKGHYLTRVHEVAIRAGTGDLDTPLPKPIVARDAFIGPEEYVCEFFRWTSAEAAKALTNDFQQSGSSRLNSAQIEIVGVRPFDKVGFCEFDTMRIAANETEEPKATMAAAPTQVDTAKQRRFSITLRNDVVYINGMTLGMLEQQVKEELRKLNYETEDFSSRPTVLSDGQSFLRAQFHSGKLASISIQERPVSDNSKDEIIDSLKASFGDKIDCQDQRSPRGNANSCTYPKNAPGGHYSLLVSFMPMRGGYNLNITLK